MKSEEVYSEIASKIGVFDGKGMSPENWVEVCSLMAKGAKVASIVKEEDISLLPFYRIGLKYLRKAPKEMSLERALETLDDADEFYSFKEQLQVVRAFSVFADRLEEWAEAIDMHHGIYWRARENTRPWARVNPEDYDDDEQPPYYGWVLVNINKIKNHFDPPLEPYATELNNNPYGDRLFAYQATRQQWRYAPRIVETLLSQMSPVQEENPLIGKYLAWGASSVAEIPTELLHGHEGQVSKELFDQNLAVRDEDYKGLFSRLNKNVDEFLNRHEDDVRKVFEEYANGSFYNETPVEFLKEKLDAVQKAIADFWLRDDFGWREVLAHVLKLPRYSICYFDWAQTSADEGPDEPGLVYTLKDGTKQHVHYQFSQSKWWDPIDQIEWKIGEIITSCKNLAIDIHADTIFDQWLNIETAWKKCESKTSPCHCIGDLQGFANAFCDGLLKISVLLPNVKRPSKRQKVEDKSEPESRYAPIDKVMAVYAKMKPSVLRFQLLCNAIKDGVEIACRGEPDFKVWETGWLTAAFQLLAEDPFTEACTYIDRQNLYHSITLAFEKLVSLFSLLQNSDPEALADEFDYFFQDINNVMEKNLRAHPVSGKKGILLTPDFVTRVGVRGNWVFNETFIRELGSHCAAKNAVEGYRDAEVSEEDQLTIASANVDRSESSCGNFAEHLLFQQAIESAEALVSELENSGDDAVKVLISDENVLGAVLQPFFGTYYTPYTRYSEKVKKDAELGLDIPAQIKRLSELVDRIFARLGNIAGCEEGCRAVRKKWNQLYTLYGFRMKNPFAQLSCQKQTEYGERFLCILKDIGELAYDGADVPSARSEILQDKRNDNLASDIATKAAAKVFDVLGPKIDAVGKSVGEEGKSLNAMGKQLSGLERLGEGTLHWVSSGAQGKPLEDGRCLQGVRESMVKEGFLLIKDKGESNISGVARRLIKKYEGRPGAYSDGEAESLRKAISRRCKDEGLDVKAMQGNQ